MINLKVFYLNLVSVNENDFFFIEQEDIDEEEDETDSDDDFKEQLQDELLKPNADSNLNDKYGEIKRFTDAILETFL